MGTTERISVIGSGDITHPAWLKELKERIAPAGGFKPKGSPPFYSIIPLEEIIAETFRVGVKSRTVKMNTYNCCKNSAAN